MVETGLLKKTFITLAVDFTLGPPKRPGPVALIPYGDVSALI